MFTKKQPIFIFGSPRSGTSLVRELLNQHPNLYVILPETCFIDWTSKFWKKSRKPEHLIVNLTRQFSKIGLEIKETDINILLEQISDNCSLGEIIDLIISQNLEPIHTRWVEKSPFHVWYLDLLYQFFPQGKFIHCIRDGRDCVASMQRMGSNSVITNSILIDNKIKNSSFSGISNWGLLGDTSLWKYSISQGISLSRQIPPQSILHLHYEEMVTNPKVKLEQLCQFLEEKNYVEKMLNLRYRNSSYGCDQSPITSQSIEIWKQVFTEHQAELIQYMMASELKELRYLENDAKFYISPKEKILAAIVYQIYYLRRRIKKLIVQSNLYL